MRALRRMTYNSGEPPRQSADHWSRRKIVSLALLSLALTGTLLCTVNLLADSPRVSSQALPELRSIYKARRLSPDELTRDLPIHVQAVVTYHDLSTPNLFVQDGSAGIWVDLRGFNGPPPRFGELLELTGVVRQGFSPYVALPKWKVLGPAPLPKAPFVNYEEAATGTFDGQWVEMEGIVRSFVKEAAGNVLVIDVATPTGTFKVRVPEHHAPFPTELVDAKVRFHGVCGSVFNRRNQLVTILLFVERIETLKVEQPAPSDPFSVAVTPIKNLARFSADFKDIHRVKVVGVVTARFPGLGFYVKESDGGLYAESDDGTPLTEGDEIEVVGFPANGAYNPILKSAMVRPTGKHVRLTAQETNGSTALRGIYDAQLVEIVGTVHARNQQGTTHTFDIESDDHVTFQAILHDVTRSDIPLKIGSKLRLTGVCSVKIDENGNAGGFQIILRSPTDLAVLSSPSWLTARRAWLILFFLTIGTVAVSAWVLILRIRVRQQTEHIKARLEKELALEERYRHMFERNLTGLYIGNKEGEIVDCNETCAHILGFANRQELLEHRREAESLTNQFHENLPTSGPGSAMQIVNGERHFRRRNGEWGWALVNIRLAETNDTSSGLLEGALVDITDRKNAEERVRFLAYYDSLTGLANRSLLHDRLAKALASARRHKEKAAVLFIDLDRFKVINDSLGHSLGDLLLKEVAQRLNETIRDQDTVARLGGDEFLLVLAAINDTAEIATAAERILKSMTAKEVVIQGHLFNISCSIGISVFPDHGTDVETLIKNADAAMYCAKEAGRNTFRFFTEQMNAQVMERLTLETSLRLAIERNELFLVYQPQLDIATGKVTGLEALLRWQRPDIGVVLPDKFIRVAENSGLIVPMGEWVIKTACAQVRKWQDEGTISVPVAVNVSATQFRQEGFCQFIGNVLRDAKLDPHFLELELTESVLLSNADVMFTVLQELKDMGLRLAIDDFGTGYSSLSYLRQFPVSKLKIDRSFIRDVAIDADDAAITAAIISMGKSLNLRVIAEGVENEAQLAFLYRHDCHEIQGYYFSQPLAADRIVERLQPNAENFAAVARHASS